MTQATTTGVPPPARASEPAAPVAPPPPGVPVGPALPLNYADNRIRAPGVPAEAIVVAVFRRIVFAAGVGLLVTGAVGAFSDRPSYNDSMYFAGWGAALVALVVPFPALSRWRPGSWT